MAKDKKDKPFIKKVGSALKFVFGGFVKYGKRALIREIREEIVPTIQKKVRGKIKKYVKSDKTLKQVDKAIVTIVEKGISKFE